MLRHKLDSENKIKKENDYLIKYHSQIDRESFLHHIESKKVF